MSRSHKAEDRCGGLAETSFLTLSRIWVIEMIRARQRAEKDSLASRLTAPQGLDVTSTSPDGDKSSGHHNW